MGSTARSPDISASSRTPAWTPYIPLPNSFHADWTIRALRAGKPVLCETTLCGSVAEAERVATIARETGTLLWEAFVFPFHAQFERIRGLLADGVIGELREIQSNFHFRVREPRDIGLSRNLEGGPSFAAAIRHINAVLMGESAPRMLAVDTSLGTARALRDLVASATAVWA